MKCFPIIITNNNAREELETFNVTVTPVLGDVTTITPRTTCVMITDDDGMSLVIHNTDVLLP